MSDTIKDMYKLYFRNKRNPDLAVVIKVDNFSDLPSNALVETETFKDFVRVIRNRRKSNGQYQIIPHWFSCEQCGQVTMRKHGNQITCSLTCKQARKLMQERAKRYEANKAKT